MSLNLDILVEPLLKTTLEAGVVVMEVFKTDFEVFGKADQSPVTEADRRGEEIITKALLEMAPEIPVVGEEAKSEGNCPDISGGIFWLVDPLDGTSNFAAGIPYYSVSLALIKSGKVTWGMVYDPERDECFSATQGQGALLNNKPMFKPESGVSIAKSTAVIDFKRLNSTLAARIAAEPPYSSQRSFGGVALDWCWLAAGRFHLYLHGKQNIWDYAAGHLVFSELCDYSCTLEGEDVFDFSLNPRSAVAAVNEHLFDQWCDYLGVTRQSH